MKKWIILCGLVLMACHKKQIVKPQDPGQIPVSSSPGSTYNPNNEAIGWDSVPQLRSVYFDTEDHTLSSETKAVALANAKMFKDTIKAFPEMQIGIGGHCDPRGTNAYNKGLSFLRAQTLRNVYLTQGIPFDKIVILAYGEEMPICSEDTDDCYQKRRRADTYFRFIRK